MRTIINFFRQCFCKHEFIYEEIFGRLEFPKTIKEKTRISRTCKKCGWHKAYWKFGRSIDEGTKEQTK